MLKHAVAGESRAAIHKPSFEALNRFRGLGFRVQGVRVLGF